MIKQAIAQVVEGQDLDEGTMVETMNQIMGGEATPAQIGAFITALRIKGETVAEITGAARVMRERATPIRVDARLDLDRDEINVDRETIVDTCGTGGSGTKSFNISTTVAFVVSACGVKVAKHGNRSISSACGSADVLEKLGVNLTVTPEQVAACVNEIGVGFLFAPALHSAMKHAIGPRREVGIRTIFNVLGPLTNPAGANRQVLGVYQKELVPALAQVLVELGCKRGFVVHGADGMDELTLTGPTHVAEIDQGRVTCYDLDPTDLGLSLCPLSELQGGDATANADIIREILAGQTGAKRDVVLLNSAYALVAAGIAASPQRGLVLAAEAIDSGRAKAQLEQLVRKTNDDS